MACGHGLGSIKPKVNKECSTPSAFNSTVQQHNCLGSTQGWVLLVSTVEHLMPNLAYKLITGEVSLFQVIYSFLMGRTPLLCTKCCLWSLLFHLKDAKQKRTNEMKVNIITKNITFFKTNSSLSLQQGKIQLETLWQWWRNIWGWGERGTAWQVCWKLNVDYPWVQKWINVFYSIILMKWLIRLL